MAERERESLCVWQAIPLNEWQRMWSSMCPLESAVSSSDSSAGRVMSTECLSVEACTCTCWPPNICSIFLLTLFSFWLFCPSYKLKHIRCCCCCCCHWEDCFVFASFRARNAKSQLERVWFAWMNKLRDGTVSSYMFHLWV